MPVEKVPNPEERGAVMANGGDGGGGGGGGGCSNSNSHNRSAISLATIREIVANLARSLPQTGPSQQVGGA